MGKVNFKIAIFIAGGAFVFSFFSALFSGGSFFGSMVIKSLLGAVLAGGLSYVGEMLLKKVFPELFVSNTSSQQEIQKSEEASSQSPVQKESLIQGFIQEMVESGEEEKFTKNRNDLSPSKQAVSQEPFSKTSLDGANESSEDSKEDGPLPLENFLESFENYEDGQLRHKSNLRSSYHVSSTKVVKLDDQKHDPVVLAKAIQTLLE